MMLVVNSAMKITKRESQICLMILKVIPVMISGPKSSLSTKVICMLVDGVKLNSAVCMSSLNYSKV